MIRTGKISQGSVAPCKLSHITQRGDWPSCRKARIEIIKNKNDLIVLHLFLNSNSIKASFTASRDIPFMQILSAQTSEKHKEQGTKLFLKAMFPFGGNHFC